MKLLLILALLLPALFALAILGVGVLLSFLWVGCMAWRCYLHALAGWRYLETRVHKVRSLLP